MYDQFILFGDSIIEHSNTQERGFGLAPALQQAYIRKLDVVNRGFSGFNTVQALSVLPQVVPQLDRANVRFMLILFGANDACFPEAQNGQHVPLEQYKCNMVKLLSHHTIEAHNSRLILVTPPPVEERRLESRVKSQGYSKLNRTNECTKCYADVAREVAKTLNIVCLDLWTAFMTKAGWVPHGPLPGSQASPGSEVIRELIHDGLHLSPQGYRVFYEELMQLIATAWPDQDPEKLSYVVPAWDDTESWEKEGLHMGSPNVVQHE